MAGRESVERDKTVYLIGEIALIDKAWKWSFRPIFQRKVDFAVEVPGEQIYDGHRQYF